MLSGRLEGVLEGLFGNGLQNVWFGSKGTLSLTSGV